MATYHLAEQPIPEGFRIYEERLQVAGIAQHKREAQSFVRAKRKWLEFERDARNPYDANAIKVIGCTKGILVPTARLRHITSVEAILGYVGLGLWIALISNFIQNMVQNRQQVREHNERMLRGLWRTKPSDEVGDGDA